MKAEQLWILTPRTQRFLIYFILLSSYSRLSVDPFTSLMYMCVVVDFGEVESSNKIFRMNKGQEMVPLTQAKNDSVFKKKF